MTQVALDALNVTFLVITMDMVAWLCMPIFVLGIARMMLILQRSSSCTGSGSFLSLWSDFSLSHHVASCLISWPYETHCRLLICFEEHQYLHQCVSIFSEITQTARAMYQLLETLSCMYSGELFCVRKARHIMNEGSQSSDVHAEHHYNLHHHQLSTVGRASQMLP